MLDETSLSELAALILHPVLLQDQNGNEPIRFGGKPRLPADLKWPKGHYHVAEIDFARVPKKCDAAGAIVDLPDMPKQGTAFIFLDLYSDGLYDETGARVLYTPLDVSDLPGREPPRKLPPMTEGFDFHHVVKEGVSSCGLLLVEQFAQITAMFGGKAINPLMTNLLEAGGVDVSDQRRQYAQHQTALKNSPWANAGQAKQARAPLKNRISRDISRSLWDFKDRHLDWEFIFDWAQSFSLGCHDMALDHLKDMKDAGALRLMVWFFTRNRKKERAAAKRVAMGSDWRPYGWIHNAPAALDKPFDIQAQAWMMLARMETGTPPDHIIDAFLATLGEIVRHSNETDDEGYNLGPRNNVLDEIVKGHDKHAGNTLVIATHAFQNAHKKAKERDELAMENLSLEERWQAKRLDSMEERAAVAGGDHVFSMGHMPLQMFGHGFDVQQSVTDNADNVLLFQLGGPDSGIPISFRGDGVLQLWIAPEDLAHARFDQVKTTLDMT